MTVSAYKQMQAPIKNALRSYLFIQGLLFKLINPPIKNIII